jgi:hypothetical protein
MIGGGATPKALDRIARKADGWIPSVLSVIEMTEKWQTIRESAALYGRADDAVSMTPLLHVAVTESDGGHDRMPCHGSIAQVVSDIGDVVQTGAQEGILSVVNATSVSERIDMATALLTALTEQGLNDRPAAG